ncbi:MAG: hypothetical protein AVDCRST_MAG93-3715 [uncultured Chloroflexia bacterium]|uniref:Uncharacterized protein n=1 Tax=uncultured Chloroflexia bacterium TaxID=1672391 RepID=A0A6J4JV69_9CHLR|nr:MAG: hypothetical protein AVDCRST_MAG93-3715 [uncultured Chloroflexia bacterium]
MIFSNSWTRAHERLQHNCIKRHWKVTAQCFGTQHSALAEARALCSDT